MAGQTPEEQPPAPPLGQPPPPGPGASPYEWQAYRHQMRARWRAQRRGYYEHWGWGGFWALVLIAVGLYFLLQNLGVIKWLSEGLFWSGVLIAAGLVLLLSRVRWGQGPR